MTAGKKGASNQRGAKTKKERMAEMEKAEALFIIIPPVGGLLA